jgi:magnesium-transporting ATPase (P-type)
VLQRCTQALTNGKGAAEPMNDAVRAALNDRLNSFARGSLRVLALAMRPMVGGGTSRIQWTLSFETN